MLQEYLKYIFQCFDENVRDLLALYLCGPTVTGPVQDPIAVLLLDILPYT